MNPKKLCSLGILDISLNLILTESQAEKYDFDIDNYNTVSDLKNLFYPLNTDYNTEIDYFKHIFLSSENNLINTLLYINRAYKQKTFIEFIMPNKLDFSPDTKFVHNLLTDVCNMNYLFIIENKLIDVNSNIKFNINIIDDETKENIENNKTFDLFEMNDLEMKLNNNEKENENLNEYNDDAVFNLDYNFDKADFFLVDLFSYKELLYKNKYDINQFLYKVISDNKQIKIILIINNNCFTGYDFTALIEKYREIIELSDYIFCDRKEINYFLRTYNNLKNGTSDIINGNSSINSKNNSSINNNNYLPGINKDLLNKKIPYNLINNTNENSNLDLIMFDNEKHRKNIPRISILFDSYFSSITLYEQIGTHMEIDTKETFHFKLKQEKVDLFLKSGKIYYYIFIGGFLSRFIHNKSFRVCFYAGYLLLEKIFKNTIKKKNIFKIDDYNVLVPNEKKGLKDKLIKLNEKILEDQKCKEKGFVLDCTNLNECKIKIYNPLLDTNCASYLLKKNIFEHLKNKGFINKNGIVLKDPDKYEKNKFNIVQKKKKIKPIFLDYDNFKLPVIQNNNNICLTAKKTNEYYSLKKINKDKEKTYYKTINNFYGQKKLNAKPNPYNNKNINDNSKTKNKLKAGLFNENNKMEEYSLRTTKNFKVKKNINSNPKKKIVINNIKLNEVKNKLDLTRNKKIPKYDVYSKHLFQLYRPDIKLANDFFEIKNKSHKKKKLKRVYSHS
jgi:hypothetical protein